MYLLYCELEEVVSNYAVSLKIYNANWNAFIHSSSTASFSYTRGLRGFAGTYRVHVFEMWEEANFFHHVIELSDVKGKNHVSHRDAF